MTPDGEPPEVAGHTIVHLSDCHLTSTGVLYNGVVDPEVTLAAVVAELRRGQANGHRFDAIVLSGDLTDTGDPDAYRRLRAAVEPLGVPLVYATGNHDVRVAFHRELLGVDDTDPRVQRILLGDRLRIVTLDSTIVGKGHGRLTDDTLAELSRILGTPAPDGTVVVLHHAPVPPPTPLLTYFTLERASRRALADVIAGTDVRLVLAGHHHLAQSGTLGGVPVAVAGSTAIRTDPLGPAGHEHTTRSTAFNLVRLYRDTHTVSVIPVDGAATVFDLDPAGCAAVVAAHPVD
ncbi:metallophosphoesterase family protein [Nakamurella deserti]|uniref:metallophosphoesterase family protein n=1 Tax=Nakamurella deserti TaxID=2164074 RepID=UPI0013006084|nr:metallophosphoesterase [Nakamurella deserti]